MMKLRRSGRRNRRNTTRQKIVRADWYEVVKLMLVVTISVMVLYGMNVAKKVPVETVEIRSSLQHVSPVLIKERVAKYISAGLFQAEINRMEADLQQIPWVYRAHVKRAWPDRLVISIEEQQATFRWGEKELLNEYAQRFAVEDVASYQHLPELSGSDGREEYLARLFRLYQKRFATYQMSLRGIHEDRRHNKVLVFDSGLRVVVGSHDVEQRLNRYLQAIDNMTPENRGRIARVDLRHANGFAIHWHS